MTLELELAQVLKLCELPNPFDDQEFWGSDTTETDFSSTGLFEKSRPEGKQKADDTGGRFGYQPDLWELNPDKIWDGKLHLIACQEFVRFGVIEIAIVVYFLCLFRNP